MKKYLLFFGLLFSFGVSLSLKGQEVVTRAIVSDAFPGRFIQFDIYLPEGYNDSADDYRWMIYLHGCCGNSNSSMIGNLKTVLDRRINEGSIDPLVVVLPNLQGFDFSNLHFWWDSERNGDIGSIITEDILKYMTSNFNVSNERKKRAIGGFSMGADGALWHGLNNSQLFCASISHSAVPDIDKYFEIAIPKVINETGQTSAPYNFTPNNGFYSNDLFGICGAWSPDLDSAYQVDFLLNDSGDIKNSVREKISEIADAKTVIKNLWQQDKKVPTAIYFDWGSRDLEFYLNTNPQFVQFLDNAVTAENWDIEYKHILFTDNQSNGHVFSVPRIDSAMVWLNGVMNSAASSVSEINRNFQIEISPNPAFDKISFKLTNENHFFQKAEVFNLQGQKVKLLKKLSSNEMDVSNLLPGVYFLNLFDKEGERYRGKFIKQ